MKKERKTKKSTEDEMNLSKKEQEILEFYDDEEKPTKYKRKQKKKEEFEIEEFDFDDNDDDDDDFEEIEIEDEEIEESKKNKKTKRQKKEIIEDKIEEFEIIDDDSYEYSKKSKKNPIQRKINIFFTIIVVLISLAVSDVINISKYNRGPYFAIPVHTYKDGGSKEYIGLGYKVIKYNETNGKKGIEIGNWFMKYDNEPIKLDIIDLAIEFNNDEQLAYNTYYNKYLRVSGEIINVSEKQNTITIAFKDEEGDKYSLNMICNMDNKDDYKTISTKQIVNVNGTMKKYKAKTKDKPGTIYLNNCSIYK